MNRTYSIPLFVIVILCFIIGCKQDEVLIPGNTAPPDTTVETFVMETYVNKAYISLLGREPSQSEFDQSFDDLLTSNFDTESRQSFIREIVDRDEQLEKLFETAKVELLNNVDTNETGYWINVFKFYLSDSGQIQSWPYYQYELSRTKNFRHALRDLINDDINTADFYLRFADNFFYDEINMGSENFVVALFQYFLDRYPTNSELNKAVLMVDGFNSDLFLQIGSSKDDLLQIFFNSDEFISGRVNYLFNKYLFRSAESEELEFYSKIYKEGNFADLQVAIFTNDEYSGL